MRFVKFIFLCFCAVFCLLSGCCHKERTPEIKEETAVNTVSFKGVWLTCYELKTMLADGSEEAFAVKIKNMMNLCSEHDINAVFIQVRPFADSVYPSALFPLSEYVLSSDGKPPEFDVLEKFIEISKQFDVAVHAWINPYRISYKADLNSPPFDNKYDVVEVKEGVYFNPSSLENQSLILGGIREILENYDVDGIHIDDYFYPVTEEKFDEVMYKEYKENGGKLCLADWRRENVNSLVSSIYSLVHSYSDELIFSISPTGDIKKNYSSHYADVELWLTKKGYADMVIPQLYYGFENEKMPFEKVADNWNKLNRDDSVKLVCGLALYKQGNPDDMAGSGVDEWVNNSDVIDRQKQYIAHSSFDGYVLFSFTDMK